MAGFPPNGGRAGALHMHMASVYSRVTAMTCAPDAVTPVRA